MHNLSGGVTGGQPDLLTKIGQLEHRIAAIQMALAATPLDDEVRLLLTEHLSVAEDALRHARRQETKPRPNGVQVDATARS